MTTLSIARPGPGGLGKMIVCAMEEGGGGGKASPKKEGSFALTLQLHFVLFTYRKANRKELKMKERKKKE